MEHGLYTTTNVELAEISNKSFSQSVQTNLEIAVPLALACHMRALRLMHKRLGHISEDRIEEIMRNNLIKASKEQWLEQKSLAKSSI